MLARLPSTRVLWTLLVAGAITTPLVWTAVRGQRLVEIYVLPASEDAVRITCKSLIARTTDGVASFDFCAEVVDPRVKDVVLSIRRAQDLNFRDQEGFPTQDGHVHGVVHLGLTGAPLTGDETDAFRLVDRSGGDVLLDGQIVARVSELVEGPRWFILAIGLLASIIQIVQTLIAKSSRPSHGDRPAGDHGVS
jgi:hypothetical protein